MSKLFAFTERENKLCHIKPSTKKVGLAEPNVPKVGMRLLVEKTNYGKMVGLAQITTEHPDFSYFNVSLLNQSEISFPTPVVMLQPHSWPLTKDEINHFLNRFFPEFTLQFKVDKLPVKRSATITITNVKKENKKKQLL